VRDLASKIDPSIKIGEVVPLNLTQSGWLADVVDKIGWDSAFASAVGRCLLRITGTLDELVATGIDAAERYPPFVHRPQSLSV
jgi:hypothetical protein